MTTTVRLSDGRVITVQTDDPNAAARAAHIFQQNNPIQRPVDTPTDVGMSTVSGAHEGVAAIPGMFGDVQEAGRQIASVVPYWTARAGGADDATARARAQDIINIARAAAQARHVQLPTTSQINNAALSA